MAVIVGRTEKWLRIITSLVLMYFDSCLHGAVLPLLAEFSWTSTNDSSVASDTQSEGSAEYSASFSVGLVFFSTGVVELALSPIVGLAADHLGFDLVALASMLIATFECFLHGIFKPTITIVLINRILQGVFGACATPVGLARIKDLYDESSTECTNLLAVAAAKSSCGFFAGLFTAELYSSMNHRVFLLFLPVCVALIAGILATFRRENISSRKQEIEKQRLIPDVRPAPVSPKPYSLIFFDLQILNIALGLFITDLARAAFEPSLAVWMKAKFNSEPSSTGLVFGLCGVAFAVACLAGGQAVSILPNHLRLLCFVASNMAGIPLIFLNTSPDVWHAGLALFVYFFGSGVARMILITMSSIIAGNRYPDGYGLVFAVSTTAGIAAATTLGPLLATTLFGSICGICIIGVLCVLYSALPVFQRNLDSEYGPNIANLFQPNRRNIPQYQIVPPTTDVSFAKHIRLVPVQPFMNENDGAT